MCQGSWSISDVMFCVIAKYLTTANSRLIRQPREKRRDVCWFIAASALLGSFLVNQKAPNTCLSRSLLRSLPEALRSKEVLNWHVFESCSRYGQRTSRILARPGVASSLARMHGDELLEIRRRLDSFARARVSPIERRFRDFIKLISFR